MRFRGTNILFIVFAVLALFVYLTEFRSREERDRAEEARKRVVQFEQDEIMELSLIYPGTTITALRKDEREWEITDPPGIEADSEEWDLLVSNVPRIEREQTIAENADNLAPFGLDDPPVRVAMKLTDGRTVEVAFGDENPSRTYKYAMLSGSGEIFLTPSSWSGIFSKSIDDLRNRKLLQFETGNIDAIRIVEGSAELWMQRSGNDWVLMTPIEAEADANEISSFLSSIRFARASSFAGPSIGERDAGLDPPALRITLHDTEANADHALLIGASPEDGRFYVRDASRSTILIIDSEIRDKARRPVFDWRDKSLARVERDRIGEVEIRRGSESFSFKKADLDWELPDGRKLQWSMVSSMLNNLEFEKAIEIIDSPRPLSTYGLDRPRLEVVFREDGGSELLQVAFGNDAQESSGTYVRTSQGASVLVAPMIVFESFDVRADDLVEGAN